MRHHITTLSRMICHVSLTDLVKVGGLSFAYLVFGFIRRPISSIDKERLKKLV